MTFEAGCQRCKERRIKRDYTKPDCQNCLRRGFTCPGYLLNLQWDQKRRILHRTQANIGSPAAVQQQSSTSLSLTESPRSTTKCALPSSRAAETSSTDTKDLTQLKSERTISSAGQSSLFELPLEQQPTEDYVLNSPSAPLVSRNRIQRRLIAHFFQNVCAAWSCFDSDANPLRSQIWHMISSSQLMRMCVLSMSAVHLQQFQPRPEFEGITYLTNALTILIRRLPDIASSSNSLVRANSNEEEILLGVILIGMSTSWHEASGLGLEHIAASRIIFKRWFTVNYEMGQSNDWSRLNFYTGCLAYWEAVASFLLDDDPHNPSYLLQACNLLPQDTIFMHPWTGISSHLWTMLAISGAIARTARISHLQTSSIQSASLTATAAARNLESWLLDFTLPDELTQASTCDDATPIQHLRGIAQCCRLAALVELYQATGRSYSPEALVQLIRSFGNANFARDNAGTSALICADIVQKLAITMINLLACIPESSNAKCLQPVLLLIGGSALDGGISRCCSLENTSSPSDQISARASIHNTMQMHGIEEGNPLETSIVRNRKAFVRDRLAYIASTLHRENIQKIETLLEKVWSRRVAEPSSNSPNASNTHWIDVMIECRLEFLF